MTTVLFTAATLTGLTDGTVDRTYRRWTVVRPNVGSRVTTRIGMVDVVAIRAVDEESLTDADAVSAGFASLAALVRWTRSKGEGTLYRVDLALAGPDPRIALRADDQLDAATLADLDRRLDRMDAAADEPWTRRTLAQIEEHPEVVARDLAATWGQGIDVFKPRVRRLKTLGLTESLPVGYRLSPRGRRYLAHHRGR